MRYVSPIWKNLSEKYDKEYIPLSFTCKLRHQGNKTQALLTNLAHYRQNIPFVCPGVERTSRAQKENIPLYMNMVAEAKKTYQKKPKQQQK